MTKIIKYIVVFLVIISFSSCYTRKSNNLLQERSSLPNYEKSVFENYMLQINDELLIRVISKDETLKTIFPNTINTNNTISYRIFEDGTADFPFVSRVPLVGKTLREAEKTLTDSLRNFANDVVVKMALKTSTFCVIGAAGRGYYPIYKERLTIYQALAMSGGMEQSAKLSQVKIVRTLPNETIIKTFDIRTKSIIDSEFYYIQPNDIIYCDFSPKKFWATSSYAGFFGVITASVSFAITVWNLAERK